jgi:signal transduction histidine kinase
MNIFGNAQKYTESGYVMVQLRVHDTSEEHSPYPEASASKTLSLRIRDSGRGMSSEYMERKLYHPFAQEDTFSPGVGLGLSIVYVSQTACLSITDTHQLEYRQSTRWQDSHPQ